MYQCRYGIKLKNTAADAAVLKLLRKHFPDASLAELRTAVQTHAYLYLSDQEKYRAEGLHRLARLLQAFDQAGLETELFEEQRDPPAPWRAEPLSRELFQNLLRRSREIRREVLTDMEREVTGIVSPEAPADIEQALMAKP